MDTPSIYSKASNGYMVARVDGRMVYEHREVWAAHHGPIPRGWQVHHKNKDRTDNRIENLECMSQRAHLRIHGKEPKQRAKVQRSIVCANCGTPAVVASLSAIYCARACAKEASNRKLAERRTCERVEARKDKLCVVCAMPFTAGRADAKYCSGYCLNRRHYIEVRRVKEKRTAIYKTKGPRK